MTSPINLTDGGLETTLVFHYGLDLPDFAAFPLLDDDDGRAVLERYFAGYLDVAERYGIGFVLDTPTWRANPDWAARLGYDRERLAALNERSVEFAQATAASRPGVACVVEGVVGPRGDGYVVGATMHPDEAADYHSLQAQAFARAGADLMTAVTMTYIDEAIGVALAAQAAGLPAAISFTVETDGSLPSGASLKEAIARVDAVTDSWPAYYMVNCAHPTHFIDSLPEGDERSRIKAVRANASRMSHAELDVAEQLDRGDIAELAALYAELAAALPDLRVVGGCCGTDDEHAAAIAAALT